MWLSEGELLSEFLESLGSCIRGELIVAEVGESIVQYALSSLVVLWRGENRYFYYTYILCIYIIIYLLYMVFFIFI